MEKRSAQESKRILSALSNETLITLDSISKALRNDNKSELHSLLPKAVQSAEKASAVLSNIWAYIKDSRSTSLPLDQFTEPGKHKTGEDRESRAIRLYFVRLAHQLYKQKRYDYASIISQSLAAVSRVAAQLACQCEFKSGRKNKAKIIAYYNKEDRFLAPFLGSNLSPLDNNINTAKAASPLLSVIVPLYNAENYLYQSLSSIVNQTHESLEIIAIDDGSTDDSVNILKSFANKGIRKITIIQNKTSVGPGASRNQGLEVARGDYIGFVDADDWVDQEYFSGLLQFAGDQTDIIFAQGYKRVQQDVIKIQWHDESNFGDPTSPLYKLYPSSTVWDKLFRKDFLVQNRILFPSLPACVDAPFVLQACHLAKRFSAKTGIIGYNYRVQTEYSVTKRKRASVYPDFIFKAYVHLESIYMFGSKGDSFRDCLLMRKWQSIKYTYSIVDVEIRPDLLLKIKQLATASDVNHIINLGLACGNTSLVKWIRELGLDTLSDVDKSREPVYTELFSINSQSGVSSVRRELSHADMQQQILIARKTKHIHPRWYEKTYPEVVSLGLEPAEHYFLYGAAQGYNPGKDFNTEYYLSSYPDAVASGLNPLVHYALYGKDAGYRIRPGRKNPEEQLRIIRFKLLSLGFIDLPLAELTQLATISDDTKARAMAALELALWHMRAKTNDDYRIALYWITRARPDALDQDFRTKLSIVELLCLHHLNDPSAGLAAYGRAAVAGEATPDLMLARVNLEPTVEMRVDWINQVLAHYEIEPITLMPDEGQPAYDRLTCAVVLPKVTEGPKVTVLIAAYDAAVTLPTALRSLQEQTWANLQIIILDDCSPTMDMMRVAEGFAAHDPRIQVVRMPQNGGAYVARNHGLDMATGEFVQLHDADDWSHPKKIETQVRFMMANPQILGCFSQQARATEALNFVRVNAGLRTITLNTSSLMLNLKEFKEQFGYWDTVRFEADTELKLRIQKKLGKSALKTLPFGPLSFQRISISSIVADPHFGSEGFSFGARFLYREAAANYLRIYSEFYRENTYQRAFSTPQVMCPDRAGKESLQKFDVIIASEFRMIGGSTRSSIEEMLCQARAGISQAVVPMYRYDLAPKYNVFHVLEESIKSSDIKVLAYGERAKCDALILRYPPILNDTLRYVPRIDAKEIKVIVNQPPMSDYGPDGVIRYDLGKCAENIRRYFGKDATWHPIGPLVREALHTHHADQLHCINLSDQDWHNIIDINGWDRGPRQRGPQDRLRIGRHSRDSTHKWPDNTKDLLAIYPARDDVEVHVLGGSKTPLKIIGHVPKNWIVHDFGSMHPRDFLRDIDIWVYFANPAWVESFGRTIIEAMAVGVPVILPEIYRPLFQDSALYATPQTALEMAKRLHADPVGYDRQVAISKAYARDNFSYETHVKRLRDIGVQA